MTARIFGVHGVLRRTLRRAPNAAVAAGLDPRWLGYRWVASDGPRDAVERERERGGDASYVSVHAPAIAEHPLPRNVQDRSDLSDDAGWWRFSFRDVPSRRSGETGIFTLPSCRLAWYRDERDDFHPAVLTSSHRALATRELVFRPGHGRFLRAARGEPLRMERATWILERVYHNYSHWLTAHLPKLVLLQARGELADVVLPMDPPEFVTSSLRMLGIDPHDHRTFDPNRVLEIERLTLLETDRYRPELLRPVRDALSAPAPARAARRVFVSREACTRRRLLNEDDIWPRFEAAGFERVRMEDLDFAAQVRLMGETAVLCAPHGAGLTNMMFCREGTHVVEIADPGFPNPNFYALSSAMGHAYWYVEARSVGDVHPLERDLVVEAAKVDELLARLTSEVAVERAEEDASFP